MIALWWSSAQPRGAGTSSVLAGLAHNAAHVVAYAVLSGAWWLSWSTDRRRSRSMAFLSVLLAAGYGVVDEAHQSFVPGRTSSVADLLSDVAGAWVAVLLLRWRVLGHVGARSLLPVALLVSAGAVCLATFGPW